MRTQICVDCGQPTTESNTLCKKCKTKRKLGIITVPDEQTLIWLVLALNYSEIANIYHVSDNTVRAWCKRYGIPSLKSDARHYAWNYLVEKNEIPFQKIEFDTKEKRSE